MMERGREEGNVRGEESEGRGKKKDVERVRRRRKKEVWGRRVMDGECVGERKGK